MEWKEAPDVQEEITELARKLKLDYLNLQRLFCFRSYGSRSRAKARIWSLPRIWQKALQTEAGYCLEVISEKFDKLNQNEKQLILIHELLHIPKNFSGSLLPHRNRKGRWLEKKVKELANKLDR